MKRHAIIVAVLLCFTALDAQESATAPGPVDPTVETYTKVPQTPNAASLGVYGEVPVGLYSGAAQFSIPLYTVQGKNLAVPITLNYATNGLNVETISPWVGAGWSLDAGGVITRNIKGKADNPNEPIQEAVDGCLVKAEARQFELEHIDLEYDRYTYNFMGKTGSFIIVDGEIKSIENQQLKFEYSGSGLNQFVITDTEGIRYYFGVDYSGGVQPIEYAQESTTSVEIKTAWYLAKIEHWGGEKILFKYGGGSFYEPYRVGFHQTRQKYIPSDSMCSSCPTSADWSPLSNVISSNYRHKPVYLVSISTPDQTDVALFEGDYRMLSKLTGKNRKIEFTLSPGGTSHRKYLKRLKISGGSPETNKDQIYKFDYYDEGTIPARDTAKRDYWGYYNGSNATNLLTGNHVPNPSYARNGSLKTITYPTGGYSMIEYEGNHKIEQQCLSLTSLPSDFSAADWHVGGVGGALLSEPYEFTVPFGQEVTFKLFQEYYPNPTPNVSGFNQGKAYFSIAGPTNHTFEQPPFDNGVREIKLYLAAGTYYFNIAVRSPIYRAMYRIDFCAQRGPVQIQYGGIKVNNIKTFSQNHDIASHKVYEYDGGELAAPQRFSTKFENNYGSGCVIETYAKYLPYCMQLVESSTGPLNTSAAATAAFYPFVTEHFMNGNVIDHSIKHTFSSSPFKSVPLEIFTTKIPDNVPIEYFGSPYELKTEYFKKLVSGITVKEKVEENIYVTSTQGISSHASFVRQIKGLIGQPFHTLQVPSDYCLENWNEFYLYYPQWFRMTQYSYIRFWQQLKEQKSTEYFYSDAGMLTQKIDNLTRFYYDNPVHKRMTRSEHIISQSTDDIESAPVYEITRYKYPDDVTSPSSLDGGILSQSNFEGAVKLNKSNSHRTGSPMQVQKFDKYGSLISSSRILYKKITGQGLVGEVSVPEKTQSMKGGAGAGSQMEDEQIFSNFNLINYKPQQITAKDGLNPTAYVYGYLSRYPIAVINNSNFTPEIAAIANQFNNQFDYDSSQFDSLESQLAALPGIQFSIFKYHLLVGISQIRDSKGNISNYHYDTMGRLIEVRDKDRNILQENEYNYKVTN